MTPRRTPGSSTSTATSTGRWLSAATSRRESTSVQHAAIGSALTSNGTAAGFFQGAVDEVRIWNVARSAAQIQAVAERRAADGAGLIGRYGLNEGAGTTASSSVAGAPAGSLDRRRDLDDRRTPRRRRPERRADDRTQRPGGRRDRHTHVGHALGDRHRLRHRLADRDLLRPRVLQRRLHRRSRRSRALRRALPRPPRGRRSTRDSATSGTRPSATARRPRPAGSARSTPPRVPIRRWSAPATSPTATARATRPPARSISGIAGAVFTAGDNVYTNGTAAEFANCFEPTGWGGATKARTRPTPGNHDWNAGNLNGYFAYFGAQAGGTATSPYYSYNIGPYWHVVVLDSDCGLVAGGCAAGSPQVQWLVNDLAANSRAQRASRCGTTRASARPRRSHRRAAVRQCALRGARRHRARRPRPHLRAVAPLGPTGAPTRTACATSPSAPAA